MFDFLKGDQAQFTVQLDRTTEPYFPGDTVHATVTLKGQKEVRVQEGRVGLVYREKYQERVREYDSEDHHWETNTNTSTNDQEFSKEIVMQQGVVPGNTEKTWTFDWVIPPDAPATYKGKIIEGKWLVKATLDRKLAKDINTEQEILVLSRQNANAMTDGGMPAVADAESRQVSLSIPKTDWLEGEKIEGKVVINPQSNFDVSEVRVELLRVENVPAHEGNTANNSIVKNKLAGGTKFQQGTPAEFPFSVEIPKNSTPTVRTLHGTAHWIVRGTLSRRLRPDVNGDLPIQVYSSRT